LIHNHSSFPYSDYLCSLNATQRYFVELGYLGTAYHGWQIQKNAHSVQETLNKALSTVCRENIETLGCGRTDTGVHARQFFAHFDTSVCSGEITGPRFLLSLNALLPWDISVKRFIHVAPDAHARFDAIERSYEYHIHFYKDPFRHNLSWYIRDIPDMELMNRAAGIVREYRDFSCFSKSNTQTFTNNCTILKAGWSEAPGGMIFRITADRFLRNMVRAIVGTLIRIGKNEITPDEIRKIIESKSRSEAGPSVPACGLFLSEVKYPYIEPQHG
jgi:tRNA pseudouridine38-40 synthase